MHESFTRLLQCAQKATAHLPAAQRVARPSDIKRVMSVSAATVTNWKGARGVSREGALAAARLFGCDAAWILDGAEPPRQSPPIPMLAMQPVAQYLSHPHGQHAPKHVAWGALMQSELTHEFQTELPDSSMAPELPSGARVIFIAGAEPAPGDFVLVRDRHGNHYCREYKLQRPGVWQAHALNPAYLPLDVERDGLEVVAVFDGVRGRRSRR